MRLWNQISHVMEEDNDCVSKSHSLTRKREEHKENQKIKFSESCYTANQESKQKKGSFTELNIFVMLQAIITYSYYRSQW